VVVVLKVISAEDMVVIALELAVARPGCDLRAFRFRSCQGSALHRTYRQ
jgi:hypothetical protein